MKQGLWYGIHGKEYEGAEPAFFDDLDLPWVKLLKERFSAIQTELDPLLQDDCDELVPYFGDDMQFPPKNWKTIGFCFWGKRMHANLDRFPEVARLVDDIPGLITVALSMLEPGSRIKPHFGDSNAVFRVHLGIKIPAGLPECGFIVKGEARPWVEGEPLIFLDANVHEAFNHSQQRRYVLLMDIIRPEFQQQQEQICRKVLSMLSLYYCLSLLPAWLSAKVQGLAKKLPDMGLDAVLLPFQMVWWLWLPFQRKVDYKKWFKQS